MVLCSHIEETRRTALNASIFFLLVGATQCGTTVSDDCPSRAQRMLWFGPCVCVCVRSADLC